MYQNLRPTAYTITITRDSNGVHFSPEDPLHVNSDDYVCWQCPDANIVVVFKQDGDSPFTPHKQIRSSPRGRPTKHEKVRPLRPEETPPKHFHYTVELIDRAGLRVPIDPDIIIDMG